MSDDKSDKVGVPSLHARVLPVLCAQARGSRFTESWHTFQGDRDKLHDLGSEDV